MSKRALIVVDVQNDFVSGTLAVNGAKNIIVPINSLIAEYTQAGDSVWLTRDWHLPNHPSFVEQGGPWPVHCVMNTWGARAPDDLVFGGNARIITKAIDDEAMSGFDGTPLDSLLRWMRVDSLAVCGIAIDHCVRATVLDARRLGYAVDVLCNAVAGVDQNASGVALDEMHAAGAVLV